MADISVELAKILSAVYGEDVRGSIHDAIEKINDVSEVILSSGTAVSSATSSSTGFYKDSFYLNTNTYELWKCTGTDTWASLGILRGDDGVGISSITKTSTSGLVDTYTITFTDTNTTTFTVTNGKDGTAWYKGTALTGTGTGITGYPGNEGDFYMNSSDGNIYNCTASGTAITALWDYVMTMSGGGSSITVYDDLVHTSTTDALSANQGHALNNPTISMAGSRTNIGTGDTLATIWGKIAKWFNDLSDLAFIAKDGPTSTKFLRGDGTWQKIDEWFATSGTVSTGSVSFSGIDDSAGTNGYELYVNVTDSSTNKNPTSQISSISGAGTASMSISFTTDADNGATAKLRILK